MIRAKKMYRKGTALSVVAVTLAGLGIVLALSSTPTSSGSVGQEDIPARAQMYSDMDDAEMKTWIICQHHFGRQACSIDTDTGEVTIIARNGSEIVSNTVNATSNMTLLEERIKTGWK